MVTLVGWPEGLSKLSPNVHEKIANADYIRKMKWIWSIFKNCPTIWAKNVVKALKWSRSRNKSSNMVTYLGGGILTRELGPSILIGNLWQFDGYVMFGQQRIITSSFYDSRASLDKRNGGVWSCSGHQQGSRCSIHDLIINKDVYLDRV